MRGALPRVRAVTLLCAALCGGCTGLHSSAQPEQTYYLRAQPTAGAAPPAGVTASLRLARPLAAPGLDSPRIVLVQADHRMSFYAASRWPAPLPDVIEALAVETLRGSGVWATVEDSASPFPADYLLQIAVRRFEADYSTGGAAPVVQVVLDCSIGRRAGSDVIATFTTSGSVPAAANRLGAVLAAFEQAGSAALAALAQQAAEAVRADTEHAPRRAGSR